MNGLMGFEEAFRVADLAVRAVRSDGLRDIERVVLEGSWNRLTYQKIASAAGYTEGYLSRDVGPALWMVLSDALGMPVKKTNFRTAIERWSKEHDAHLGHAVPTLPIDETDADSAVSLPTPESRADPLPFDIADFRGRQAALAELSEWVTRDRGRLLCISGVPGVGKSWLAVKLADEVRSHFRRLIYWDMSDRPEPLELVEMLLAEINGLTPPPTTLKAGLENLIQALTQWPCLIILDGVEVFCGTDTLAGTYEPDFEEYSQFLEALASRDHQSCVLWVGQSLARATAPMVGSSYRFQWVDGLQQDEVASLAFWPETIEATSQDWRQLSADYGGLPTLISREIAPRLSSFSNSLEACLDAVRWDNRFLTDYLDKWLAPLTEAEHRILTGLMISHQPLSLNQLSELLGTPVPLRAAESLCDRGLCRLAVNGETRWELALPNLLVPYLCDRWLATFRIADEAQRVEQLHRYPLLQAEAPEVVRQWQRQTLLEAVADLLAASLPRRIDKQAFLQQALQRSQHLTRQSNTGNGYSAGNLINLARHWHISLVTWDLQGLKLQEADLQSDLFQGVSFADADFNHTLLAKPLGQCPVMAVSPNKAHIAVGDQDGRLLLWNLQDGRLQRVMLTVAEALRTLAFSPDGALLAEGRADGSIRLWDLRSDYGPELFTTLTASASRALLFSADKKLLVGGDDAGNLHVWRLASGETLFSIDAHEASITAIALSPCSRRLITCGQDCVAIEWDLDTGEPLHRFQGRLTNSLCTVAYVPDSTESGGRAVVIGRDENRLVIWDIASAQLLRVMDKACDLIMALALSPDGRYLAASEVNNKVSVWDVNSKSRLYQISESNAPIESLTFSPDGRDLITGCDYQVQCWQVRTGQCLRIWRSDRHPANRLTLTSQPLQLLSSHDDQTVRCWQFSEPRQRWLPQERLSIPSQEPISSLSTSQQGTYHVVGTEAGTLHVWHREQQIWLTWSMRLPTSITALTFSADDRLLAAGDAAGNVALWDLADHIFRWQKNQPHADRVTALAFTPDSQRVFSGSRDRTIQSWDLKGSPMGTLSGHRRRIHTLCVSQDGNTLYSGSYDHTVRAWNLANHTCDLTWQKGDQHVACVTLNERQRPVVVLSDTQTIELWELEVDQCRFTVESQEGPFWHVSTSLDGTALVGAAQGGTITLWALFSGEQQAQLRVDRPYEAMQIGGCSGLTEPERQMLYSLGATDN